MMAYDRQLKVFETELNRNSDKIFNNIRGWKHLHLSKNVKKLRSQAQNDVNLGSDYLDLSHRPELHYNGMDMQAVGNLLPSPDGGYADMELNKYLNFDSNVAANQREDLEGGGNQSLEDFFQDFQEIISSEMRPIVTTASTTTPYHHDNAATNIIPYGEPSAGYNSAVAGVDFNLDLTQFYINTNEADFLNADELKTDLSNGLIPLQSSQFTYHDKGADDSPEFSVIDLSTGNTKIYGKATQNSATSQSTAVDTQVQFSATIKSDQAQEMAEYSDTKISVSTPLDQFYLDFELNGETSTASDPVDNSIVTYISKDVLQSVEYINESGQTETVMYVDQQSDEKDGSAFTQYEIINFDEYQYQTENANQLQFTSNSQLVPDISSVPYYGDNLDNIPQTDILSTLLSDKSNKITLMSKPFKNPKVRQSCDEFFLKFDEIDANPTNIAFAQQPKAKGCRKQKFETINYIELEIMEPRPTRPDKAIPTTPKSMPTPTTTIPETPKLPSRFMRDRKRRMEAKRRRPRKLAWHSESDCENGARLNKKSKSSS